MTKKVFLIIIILFSLSFMSCEDWLNLLPPQGLVPEEYWKNKEDVEAVLMNAYRQFASLDGKLFEYGELRADMIKAKNNLPQDDYNITVSNIYPTNTLCNWAGFYSVIHHCNLVLKHAKEVQQYDPTFIDYDLKRFLGEALFLRSLAYFYLVRVFNDVPLVLKPYEDDNANFFVPKTKSDVILDTLVNNLKTASNYLPNNLDYGSVEENKGRATIGAIYALLADISLWRFEYTDCINYVQKIEDLQTYALVPAGQWYNIFYPGNTLEGIFELQFDGNLGQSNHLFYLTWSTQNYFGVSDYAMQELAITVSKEIVRGNGSVRETDASIWKYVGSSPDGISLRPAAQLQNANWIVYRLADVLLMKAEALAELGQFDEALNIINKIRSRASMPNAENISNTKDAFEGLILEERAKELAYEGKRWYDLLRMGRRNNYARKNDLIQILIRNVSATQKRVMSTKLNDPLGWYLPIYESELERNKNLVQNDYYNQYSGGNP